MKNQRMAQVLKWLAIVGFSVIWITYPPRILSALLMLIAVLLGMLQFRLPALRRWALGAFSAALVTVLLPIDITFHNAPGPPHFVPYVTGMPSAEGRRRHQRGEIYLSGSCFVFENEPRYVLVW